MNIIKDTKKQAQECINVYINLFIIVIFIMLLKFYLQYTYESEYIKYDPFNRTVFEWNWLENCCSWWPISHFILFAILAFIYPNCEKILFICGVGWEILEVIFASITNRGIQPMITISNQIQYSQNWWAGSFKDIIFNTLGIIFGKFLRNLVK